MRIQAFHSQFGGYEYLSVQRPGLWNDIQNVFAMVDANHCRVPRARRIRGAAQYSSRAIAETTLARFSELGWLPIKASSSETYRVLRDRVAVELEFCQPVGAEMAFRAKHLALFVDDAIDVAVGVMPTRDLESQCSSRAVAYENAIGNLRQHERRAPAVPLVLIGVAP